MEFPMQQQSTCSIDECGRRLVIARSWCRKHYYAWRRHGDPLIDLRSRSTLPEVRFWAMVERKGADECWESRGSRSGSDRGYARIFVGDDAPQRLMLCHRFSWELHYGPIP